MPLPAGIREQYVMMAMGHDSVHTIVGHDWVQQEQPDYLTKLIVDFLQNVK